MSRSICPVLFLGPQLSLLWGSSYSRKDTHWTSWHASSVLSLSCEPLSLGGPGRNHRYQITRGSKRVSSPPRGLWGPASTTHSLPGHEERSGSHRWPQARVTRLGCYLKEPESPVSAHIVCGLPVLVARPVYPPLGFRRPLTQLARSSALPLQAGRACPRPPPPASTPGLGSSQACPPAGCWGGGAGPSWLRASPGFAGPSGFFPAH